MRLPFRHARLREPFPIARVQRTFKCAASIGSGVELRPGAKRRCAGWFEEMRPVIAIKTLVYNYWLNINKKYKSCQ